jgi:5'-nucleotidase
MRHVFATIALVALAAPHAVQARNIVITNDDGLTANVIALYTALKADGHDVIVSVPCQNQSGMGAALGLRPLTPLETACRNNAAGIGAPGAGPMTREGFGGDFYYVNSTPVMALLYGLDVAAMKRWGAAPDLVLSGPNEGQNVGAIIISSGTVSAAQAAALRGIPSVALSAGQNTTGQNTTGQSGTGQDLVNALSPIVAEQSADFVTALDMTSGGGRMLPAGLALNVNFPDEPTGAAFCAAQVGTYNNYALSFTENVAAAATPEMMGRAKAYGQDVPALPGVLFGQNAETPTAAQMQDESVLYRTCIAVSPMQAGYGIMSEAVDWFGAFLSALALKP